MSPSVVDKLATVIDHSLLKPEATAAEIRAHCEQALEWNVAAACVTSSRVSDAAVLLTGSSVALCSVIGFPSGAVVGRAKREEAAQAIDDGATEVDMVLDLGALLDRREHEVGADICAVRSVVGSAVLKTIIESSALTEEQIVRACRIAVDAGANFVKTSTGFHPSGGATAHAVALMKRTVGPDLGVKASGGIRTLDQAQRMLAAGASRLGLSATVAVLTELQRSSG